MAVQIYIVIILAIIIGAILFFPMWAIVTAIATNVSIPADMGGDWYNFIISFRNWYLLIVILVPLLVYVFVQTQKPKAIIIEG